MLDAPEIYFEDEYNQLNTIKKSPDWNFIHTLWQIRKINWNYKSIAQNQTELDLQKSKRSTQISKSKILVDNAQGLNVFSLSDFKYFRKIFPPKEQADPQETLCYLSPFLETNSRGASI